MKKTLFSIAILFPFSLAIAAPYNFFGGFIPQGTPNIDGHIQDGEWNSMGRRVLYKFFGEDSKVEFYHMWDNQNLYLAAKVEDFELWIDNYNPTQPWFSTWDDDAVKWELDLDRSRGNLLQPSDRVFATNANGSASRFDQGNGFGGTIGASSTSPIQKRVTYSGTLNDASFKDVSLETRDQGYMVEVAIPWVNLATTGSNGVPYDGKLIGMNFTQIEDDTGGPLDPNYYRQWKRVYDEITRFMGEEGYPENWAEFSFSLDSDLVPPGSLGTLISISTSAYSTRLKFQATGDNASNGYAAAYDVRYSKGELTEANWNQANIYHQAYRPQKSGTAETLEIIGLQPATDYQIGIRALDERGNAGNISVASVTTAANANDKGFITTCPGRRYFCHQDGSPLVVIGDNQGISWPKIRSFYNGEIWDPNSGEFINYYELEGPSVGRAYLEKLSNNGVNTIRLILEGYDSNTPFYLFTDVSQGASAIQFKQETLEFSKTFVDACADYGINVILTPFDTFYYRGAWAKNPFNTLNGGPMSTADEFFAPENRDYLTAVWSKLIETLGNRKNILAWEIVNEFDSDDAEFGWNRASFSAREQAVIDLTQHVKNVDPNHLTFISSVRWDPKFSDHISASELSFAPGADAALVLNNGVTDFNSTHMYYHDLRDPNHNNENNRATPTFMYESGATDQDNLIAPAQHIKQGLQFYFANSLQPVPYMDTESGPIIFFTERYDQFFTQQQDNEYFLNMIWTHLTGGDAGSGLRWPGEMLDEHALTDEMRSHQKGLSRFVEEGIDFSVFSPQPIGQTIEISNASTPLVKIGVADTKHGMLFLLKDTRKRAYGDVSGAILKVPDLEANTAFTFEFWDPENTEAGAIASTQATSDGNGNATVAVPTFAKRIAVKFMPASAVDSSPVVGDGSQLINISTRAQVNTGSGVMVGGFVIQGTGSRQVLIKGVGPSLGNAGISGTLSDPELTLFSAQGEVLQSNDNWEDSADKASIGSLTLAPSDRLESAILASLAPGAYTAYVSGKSNSTGVGMVEVYTVDGSGAGSQLINISTRAQINAGNGVMVGGFVIQGTGARKVLIKGVGPTLTAAGIAGALADPVLTLYSSTGEEMEINDNWADSANAQDIAALSTLAPSHSLDSAILRILSPGAYTAYVAGANGTTGIGMVEVYIVE